MNCSPEPDSPSTTVLSLPRLIIFRFLHITSLSSDTLTLSWSTVEGASFYTVQLVGPEEVILQEKVPSNGGSTEKVVYSVETPLLPGHDYLLTVEIDKGKSYLDSCQANNSEEIAQYVLQGVEKINKAELPDKLQATVRARLDCLLICRDEVIRTLQAIVDQGSHTEAVCFMLYFLCRESALKSLAEACSSNEILEALDELRSQLAAVNATLGDYCYISGGPKSLFEDRYAKAIELALSTQSLEGLTAAPQSNAFAVFRSATSVPSYCADLYNWNAAFCCSISECRGYHRCQEGQ